MLSSILLRELLYPQDGLEKRGFKESGFLNEVAEVVRTGNVLRLYPFFSHVYLLMAMAGSKKLLILESIMHIGSNFN